MKLTILKVCLGLSLLLAAPCAQAQTVLPNLISERYGSYSLIGDSFSTFMGFTEPLENLQWYPCSGNNTVSVEMTWWMLLGTDLDLALEQNNSYSGSVMCTHGWGDVLDVGSSFVGRVENLREAGLILVEGATNDNNVGVELGEYVYSDFTDAQKYTFRGGAAYVLDYLRTKYPDAEIVFTLNTGLKDEINESVEVLCEHYDIPLVKWTDITKISDHPNRESMKRMAHQLEAALCEINDIHYFVEGEAVNVDSNTDDATVMVGKQLRKDQWNSLCLPFNMSAEAIEAAFGEGTEVQTIDSYADGVVYFKSVSTIEANRPYFIRPTVAVDHSFTLGGAALRSGGATTLEAADGCTMYGLYTSGTYNRNYYFYTVAANGKLCQLTTSSEFPATLGAVIKSTEEIKSIVLEGQEVPTLPVISADSEIFAPIVKNHHLLPVTPLLTSDPFLSIWSQSENLYDEDTKFIYNSVHPLQGYAEIDGVLYRFMGAGDSSLETTLVGADAQTELAQQTYKTITATQTYYTFTCGAVELTLVFSTPQLVNDETTLDAAVNYISYKVEALDGQAHDVNIHLGVSRSLAMRTTSESTKLSIDNTEGVSFGKVGTSSQSMSEGVLPNWGYILLMADEDRNQSMQTTNYYLVFTDEMGSTTEAAGYTLLGRDENEAAIGFGYARFPAAWTLSYHSFPEVMVAYANEIEERLAACRAFDKMIYSDALHSAGSTYADMCQNVYRQVIAGTKRALSDSREILMYNADVNDVWYINLADQCFACAPLFLLYNPQLAYDLFESTPDYIRQYTGFSSPYGNAPHHLGDWPIMAGSNLDNGVDATTDMCILAGAAVKCGVDANSIPEESYEYLTSLCDYLDLFTLSEYADNFYDEGSADNNGGIIHDYANLRLKSILSMLLVSDIADARGDAVSKVSYRSMAQRWKESFLSDYAAGDHYTQGNNVAWGLKYPLYYDKALGIDEFSDIIEMELEYYKLNAFEDYGLRLDARSSTYAKVHENVLTASMSIEDFDMFVEPVLNYMCSYSTERPIADVYNCTKAMGTKGFGSTALGSLWAKVLIDKLLDIPSGIQELPNDGAKKVVEGIYDLQGRKLNGAPTKGVYIINGQKVVVK